MYFIHGTPERFDPPPARPPKLSAVEIETQFLAAYINRDQGFFKPL
jgi:hypothetical protein